MYAFTNCQLTIYFEVIEWVLCPTPKCIIRFAFETSETPIRVEYEPAGTPVLNVLSCITKPAQSHMEKSSPAVLTFFLKPSLFHHCNFFTIKISHSRQIQPTMQLRTDFYNCSDVSAGVVSAHAQNKSTKGTSASAVTANNVLPFFYLMLSPLKRQCFY